jgi:hypothetical protein
VLPLLLEGASPNKEFRRFSAICIKLALWLWDKPALEKSLEGLCKMIKVRCR